MTTPEQVEPHAGASVEDRRRFLSLTALFLAGPIIWTTHFMAVYLLAEAACTNPLAVEVLGAPLVSVVTVAATAFAVAATAFTARAAHRRWRRTGTGWDGSASAPAGPDAEPEHDGDLALAGYLLGLLFIVALLFVGLPALVLPPC